MPDTQYRTDAPEIMDDFELEGEPLREALDSIADINRLLGGKKVTINGVRQLLSGRSQTAFTIADVGCGNGDMLRELARYGRQNGLELTLLGIDANLFTINYARSLSLEYPEIRYSCEDLFDPAFGTVQYDIVLCTLTLHHFSDDAILNLMRIFSKNATTGIVINDLHRSNIAYRLFGWIGWLFRLNQMSRADGLTSILRGFKRSELEKYSEILMFTNYTIRWKWAFRYQWIIKTI